jgi:hypothetical protein
VPSKDIAEAILCRQGRGGQSRMTTPSALSEVASRHFLDAQPPLLSQEGTNGYAEFKTEATIRN